MKKGLVLEGGAMRGMFTCGIIDVFLENNIDFDGAIGVSAGATFGCNIKSRQIGRALRYNKQYSKDPRYGSFRSLLKTGDYYGAEFCYRILPEQLDPFDTDTFAANPMEFYCVAADLKTGKPVYHKCTDGKAYDLEWIRASASMPLFSEIVKIDGGEYLDGGAASSVPLEYFESIGYEKNVVILTQPLSYLKKPNSTMPLIRVRYKDYPEFVKAMENRHVIYNRETRYVREQAGRGKALILAPEKPLDISRIENDPEELERVYYVGRAMGEAKLHEIRKFLGIEPDDDKTI